MLLPRVTHKTGWKSTEFSPKTGAAVATTIEPGITNVARPHHSQLDCDLLPWLDGVVYSGRCRILRSLCPLACTCMKGELRSMSSARCNRTCRVSYRDLKLMVANSSPTPTFFHRCPLTAALQGQPQLWKIAVPLRWSLPASLHIQPRQLSLIGKLSMPSQGISHATHAVPSPQTPSALPQLHACA